MASAVKVAMFASDLEVDLLPVPGAVSRYGFFPPPVLSASRRPAYLGVGIAILRRLVFARV